MKSSAFHILRVGIAITFVWIGVLILREPEAWGGFLKPWAAGLLPIPLKQAMIGTAALDILVGLALLVDFKLFWAASIGFIHVIMVLVVAGIDSVTVRDIAIGAGLLALIVDSWPLRKDSTPLSTRVLDR